MLMEHDVINCSKFSGLGAKYYYQYGGEYGTNWADDYMEYGGDYASDQKDYDGNADGAETDYGNDWADFASAQLGIDFEDYGIAESGLDTDRSLPQHGNQSCCLFARQAPPPQGRV